MATAIDCMSYYCDKKGFVRDTLKDEGLNNKYFIQVIQLGTDEQASKSYINGKRKDCKEVGIGLKVNFFNTSDIGYIRSIYDIITEMNSNTACCGIIVEVDRTIKKRYPKYVFQNIYDSILPSLDLDGLGKRSEYLPCTAEGTIGLLTSMISDLKGKVATVVGRSELVGKPIANMLIDKGVTVICCNSTTSFFALQHFTRISDIIISAAGVPDLILPEMLNPQTIVIDIGTNFVDGKLVGDVSSKILNDYNLHCILYTPVPKGMGLITRGVFLEHALEAIVKREKNILPNTHFTLKFDNNAGDFILVPYKNGKENND